MRRRATVAMFAPSSAQCSVISPASQAPASSAIILFLNGPARRALFPGLERVALAGVECLLRRLGAGQVNDLVVGADEYQPRRKIRQFFGAERGVGEDNHLVARQAQ